MRTVEGIEYRTQKLKVLDQKLSYTEEGYRSCPLFLVIGRLLDNRLHIRNILNYFEK